MKLNGKLIKLLIFIFLMIMIVSSFFLYNLSDSRNGKMKGNTMTEQEKSNFDLEYKNDLKELVISRTDFLMLVKYISNLYEKNIFENKDNILGDKIKIYTKGENKNLEYYAYYNIPHFDKVGVLLECESGDVVRVFIGYVNDGSFFHINGGNINILKLLNINYIGKDRLYYSNKLVIYHYKKGSLYYNIIAENSDDFPEDFYSFEIMKDKFNKN